uniref:Transcription initiation factor TFIID subunit 12 domain-containing protein n=1 Tax=Brassica campestris TaxID=3711 RepID=M4EZ49_BRACM
MDQPRQISPASQPPETPSKPSTQQSLHATNQPWLSSSTQGKPPLAPPSYRPLVNNPSMHHRSHVPHQHLSTSPSTSQPQEQLQQLISPQQPFTSPTSTDPCPRFRKSESYPLAMPAQPPMPQPGNQAKTVSSVNEESDDRILGKRSIDELFQQIDPSEKLDPEVEATLADIAEDFVEAVITMFNLGLVSLFLKCTKNWNIRPPGFSSDEIKTFRKPLTTDIHKERLAATKTSVTVTEAANARNPFRHGTANARGGQAKTPAKSLGLYNF